jgi:ribose 5-phosphate isomerase A
MDEEAIAAAKRRAAESAVEAVGDGNIVGLGTGSTAAHAIQALGEAVDAGLSVEGVPTSCQSRALAREAGVPLIALADVARVDVAIDGADETLLDGSALIKGGGAAHAREKVVDTAADRFLLVVDKRKLTETLTAPLPVEVLPDARSAVAARVEELGGDPTLRAAERKDGPVVTDNGNFVLDCAFGAIGSPTRLAAELAAVPGVVEHGLFVGLADEIHAGGPDGVRVTRR